MLDENFKLKPEDDRYDPRKSPTNQKKLLKFLCSFGLVEPAKQLIRKCNANYGLSLTVTFERYHSFID